ncbi:rhamnose ABC transporter substrate-binding protein [Arthrobacter sp. ISL-69]|uniref:rhamnose ABC transporter substrate-binding protein n=1 Tax=Arthrobacter sp. ISL-69 TaxID=2819113 RepID=UPI001BE82D76|nr:rhamnose ABC transporter substrate-binding protein [Arthrobacter sp. ISL-69]MBT2539003.1 rhamnose ABC transporter substrate-binding protein [Arthrobacter sp. ISL-69]
MKFTTKGSRRVAPAFLAIATGLTLALTACGGTTVNSGSSNAASGGASTASADPNAPLKEGLKVAFLPKQLNNSYFTVTDRGGKTAVGEFKGQFSEVGPSEASASSQVSYINTLTQQGSDVIVTSANDPKAICSALDEARSAGAKVVTFDSDTDPECRDVYVNQATAEGIAATQVKLISEAIGAEGGDIAILSATANATNQNAWIELMKKELQKAEYSKLKLVSTVYGDDNAQKSQQEVQALLQQHPNLKGIISPTTVGVAAAAQYLAGSEYKGKVQLTGLGFPSQLKEFVKNGTMKSFALWDVEKLGYLAAYTGAALASGQITGAEGEKFKAGDMGEFTIGDNGIVLLGEPTEFTADNIDQFNF